MIFCDLGRGIFSGQEKQQQLLLMKTSPRYFGQSFFPNLTMHLAEDGAGAGPAMPEPKTPNDLLSYRSASLVTSQEIVTSTAAAISPRLHSFLGTEAISGSEDSLSNGRLRLHDVRFGAGASILGYSKAKPSSSLHTILAYTPTLRYLRSTLSTLSQSREFPLALNLIAQDYDKSSSTVVNNDYYSTLKLASELGLAVVSSKSVSEAQHMTILASLLAETLPTVHLIDGLTATSASSARHLLKDLSVEQCYKRIRSKHVHGKDPLSSVTELLTSLNDEFGTHYAPFEYHGHASPRVVLVVFGAVEATIAAQIAEALSSAHPVAVINVRIYCSFDEASFLSLLPPTVKTIAVLGQVQASKQLKDKSAHSALYQDVLSAVYHGPERLSGTKVVDLKYPRPYQWTADHLRGIFTELLTPRPAKSSTTTSEKPRRLAVSLEPSEISETSIWDLDRRPAMRARDPEKLLELFRKFGLLERNVSFYRDILSEGGITRIDVRQSVAAFHLPYQIKRASFGILGDLAVLKHYDVIRSLRKEATLLVRLPGFKLKDVEKQLSAQLRKGVVDKQLSVVIFDPSAIKELAEDQVKEQELFLDVIQAVQSGKLDEPENVKKTTTKLEAIESWKIIEKEEKSKSLPATVRLTGFATQDLSSTLPAPELTDSTSIAKSLAFREAYGVTSSVRPDLSVKTHQVTVKEIKRLTPLDYDRNVFNIEFDLGTSGLTYDIGEALGIHGENDKSEVMEFMSAYGLEDPEAIVQVPSLSDPTVFESRTVFQSLMQNVDIFGKPPKKFYESLAQHATDTKEKQALLTLTTPDGATQFKRLSEVDTVTFADVLLAHPSARPTFPDLVQIIPPVKRREYSIASCQKVQPDSVTLLVVVVNWQDPRGRNRFGQCTRYLANLPIGAPVTVSVKPSVMKLPAESTAPLIMAGLGTGLAPFRAFCQYRAWQREQGLPIGQVLLYLGSRHQREEYLYGEEWEAWRDAGVITLLGCAFSRDQREKVYIQDRMRQSLREIREAYLKGGGSFYLCGPTWPVPDVTEVLVEAVEEEAESVGKKRGGGKRVIDDFKDEGRYVLEVY